MAATQTLSQLTESLQSPAWRPDALRLRHHGPCDRGHLLSKTALDLTAVALACLVLDTACAAWL